MELHVVRKTRALASAIALGISTLAGAAETETLQDVRAQIDALQRKIQDLEQRQRDAEQRTAIVPPDVVTGGATRGSFKLPGSNTSVTLGGYAKLDAVFSDPSAGVDSKGDLFLDPTTIAVGPAAGLGEHNEVKFGARESRLFVKTSTPTALGDLATHVEFDFYGADGNESVSNSHGLRLRHAYGVLGHLLAGQTWTNFMDPATLPETLDFGGPVGQIFDRQAQVRWTQPLPAGSATAGQWSVALENPESVVQVPGGGSFRADDDRWPDLTGALQFDTTIGRISVRGLVRQIRLDSAEAPASTDAKLGAALSVAGLLPLAGKDDFRFTATAGNGIGRYSNGFFPDGVVGADGQLRLPKQWGWFAAYRHYWSDPLRSNVVLSSAAESNPAGAPANTNRSTRSAHVDLIWTPVANTDLGIEYIYGYRQTEDGESGHLNRLQASAKYTF